ncbi:MAG: hypothetical protein SA339_07860 [Methanomassiliicoccus sp.]|nr:hypothetical protein [Methanomassiliicoccus sp.]
MGFVMLGGRVKLSAAVILVIVIVVAGISLPLLLIDFRTVSINEVDAVPSNGSGRLDLKVKATVGELAIVFMPLDGDAVRVESNVQGQSNLFGKASPLRVDVNSTNSTGPLGTVQSVNVTLNTYAPWPNYALKEVGFTIAIDENLRTRLNLSVITGGISLATARGVVIEGLEINSTAKGAVISFENGTVLAGDVRIKTATGGSVLSWNDVEVLGSRNLNIMESSGPIVARFDQSAPMNGTVNMKVADTVGEVRLGFFLDGQVSAKVTCGWDLGTPQAVNLGGFDGTPANFQSHNYPSEDRFRVQVNQTLGNIHLDGSWTG